MVEEPLVLSTLLANVHLRKPLVWFKASGFWSIIIIGILLGSPLGYLVTISSLGDPAGIVPQAQYVHELQQVLDGVDIRVH